jgi:DNA-binding response OmpR family regulator
VARFDGGPAAGPTGAVWPYVSCARRPRRERVGAMDEPRATDSGALSNRPHVVIVDDDATMREILQRSLRQAGHQVTAASNGIEAIEAVVDPGIVLVLLDLGLPDLDGINVLRQIRDETDLPVIVVSGHSAEHVRRLRLKIEPGPTSPRHVVSVRGHGYRFEP